MKRAGGARGDVVASFGAEGFRLKFFPPPQYARRVYMVKMCRGYTPYPSQMFATASLSSSMSASRSSGSNSVIMSSVRIAYHIALIGTTVRDDGCLCCASSLLMVRTTPCLLRGFVRFGRTLSILSSFVCCRGWWLTCCLLCTRLRCLHICL